MHMPYTFVASLQLCWPRSKCANISELFSLVTGAPALDIRVISEVWLKSHFPSAPSDSFAADFVLRISQSRAVQFQFTVFGKPQILCALLYWHWPKKLKISAQFFWDCPQKTWKWAWNKQQTNKRVWFDNADVEINVSSNIIDAHTHPYACTCIYTHIYIYTYVHNLQRVCRRCVRWCKNTPV